MTGRQSGQEWFTARLRRLETEKAAVEAEARTQRIRAQQAMQLVTQLSDRLERVQADNMAKDRQLIAHAQKTNPWSRERGMEPTS